MIKRIYESVFATAPSGLDNSEFSAPSKEIVQVISFFLRNLLQNLLAFEGFSKRPQTDLTQNRSIGFASQDIGNLRGYVLFTDHLCSF